VTSKETETTNYKSNASSNWRVKKKTAILFWFTSKLILNSLVFYTVSRYHIRSLVWFVLKLLFPLDQQKVLFLLPSEFKCSNTVYWFLWSSNKMATRYQIKIKNSGIKLKKKLNVQWTVWNWHSPLWFDIWWQPYCFGINKNTSSFDIFEA